jgi:phosphoenolpyruvate phosphomutase
VGGVREIAYVGMAGDILHSGHVNILNEANKLGDVVVGLLTDEAIASYKRVPILDFEQRLSVISSLSQVSRVIPQETLDYTENLIQLKPRFLVHGTDWKTGVQSEIRSRAIEAMSHWGGEIIEPEYTEGVSSTSLISSLHKNGIPPEIRRSRLARIMQVKGRLRAIEVHGGLTGLIAENCAIIDGVVRKEFDAMWLSSLTHSTSKGKPDNGIVDITSVTATLNDILDSSSKPIIVDLDNGGPVEHFALTMQRLERLGISAVIIEDKVGSKKNSLFGDSAGQIQDSIEDFSKKISIGKEALVSSDFMIIARIESLILGRGMDDALERSHSFVNAGASGIMIHSKSESPNEILEFLLKFRDFDSTTPLVVVPSTYSSAKEDDLHEAGANIVIYANQLTRSAYPAMMRTAESILENERSLEAEEMMLPIKEIIRLIPVD